MRRLIKFIIAIVIIVSFFNLKNEIKGLKLGLEDAKSKKTELEDTITALEGEKEALQEKVASLDTNNADLNRQIASIQDAKDKLAADYDELEIAYQNEYPDIGVTLKDFVQNFEHLTTNVDNFKEKALALPNESDLLMGIDGRNFNTRYHIERGEINYSLNIGGRLEKNNILKIRMSYNNIINDEADAQRIVDYTTAILSAYFMALESPMEYTDAVAEKVTSLMQAGSYTEGDLVMKCNLDSFEGYTYIKNINGLLSIFD